MALSGEGGGKLGRGLGGLSCGFAAFAAGINGFAAGGGGCGRTCAGGAAVGALPPRRMTAKLGSPAIGCHSIYCVGSAQASRTEGKASMLQLDGPSSRESTIRKLEPPLHSAFARIMVSQQSI